MMSRTQITLDPETQRCARQRSHEYIRRLVARDLGNAQAGADPSVLFDLGSSGGSDIAANKDKMIGQAFAAAHKQSRRSSSAS